MKKIYKLIISILAISTMLIGCGGEKANQENGNNKEDEPKAKVVEKVPGLGDIIEVDNASEIKTTEAKVTLEEAKKLGEKYISDYIETLSSNSAISIDYGGKINISDERIAMRATEDTEKTTEFTSDTISEFKYSFYKNDDKDAVDFESELNVVICKNTFEIVENSLVQKYFDYLNKSGVKVDVEKLISLVNNTILNVPVGYYSNKNMIIEQEEDIPPSSMFVSITHNEDNTYRIDFNYSVRFVNLKNQ